MEKFDKFIFLIGGMDLEMSTIIELLNSNNLNYIDKQLQWGATLSVYQSYFNDENIFVGIELIEDIEVPRNFHATSYRTIKPKVFNHHQKSKSKKSNSHLFILCQYSIN